MKKDEERFFQLRITLPRKGNVKMEVANNGFNELEILGMLENAKQQFLPKTLYQKETES